MYADFERIYANTPSSLTNQSDALTHVLQDVLSLISWRSGQTRLPSDSTFGLNANGVMRAYNGHVHHRPHQVLWEYTTCKSFTLHMTHMWSR